LIASSGGVVATGHDFQEWNVFMPPPIYAWMGWAQILSPSQEQYEKIRPLIVQAYELARQKLSKKFLPRL
jgi:predicted DNA-binding protein (MmcQ/YjbR family)